MYNKLIERFIPVADPVPLGCDPIAFRTALAEARWCIKDVDRRIARKQLLRQFRNAGNSINKIASHFKREAIWHLKDVPNKWEEAIRSKPVKFLRGLARIQFDENGGYK